MTLNSKSAHCWLRHARWAHLNNGLQRGRKGALAPHLPAHTLSIDGDDGAGGRAGARHSCTISHTTRSAHVPWHEPPSSSRSMACPRGPKNSGASTRHALGGVGREGTNAFWVECVMKGREAPGTAAPEAVVSAIAWAAGLPPAAEAASKSVLRGALGGGQMACQPLVQHTQQQQLTVWRGVVGGGGRH